MRMRSPHRGGAGPGRFLQFDLQHEPAVWPGRDEVLGRLRTLAALADGPHVGADCDQRRLKVTARALATGRRTQVPSEGRLSAHLGISDLPCGAREWLWPILQLGYRRHRADRETGPVTADPGKSGVLQPQDALGPQSAVVDLGHQDRAPGQHGYSGTVSELLHGFFPGRRDDEHGFLQGCRCHSPLLLESYNPPDSVTVLAIGATRPVRSV